MFCYLKSIVGNWCPSVCFGFQSHSLIVISSLCTREFIGLQQKHSVAFQRLYERKVLLGVELV